MALRALRATFAKTVRGDFLPLLSSEAPSPSARSSLVPAMAQSLAKALAANARSGLVTETGIANVLPTMTRVLPKAPAASACSIGLADVMQTMPRVLPKAPAASARSGLVAKFSLADLKQAIPQVHAKAPAAGHALPKARLQAPSGGSRSTAWVSRPHGLRDAFTKGAAGMTRGISTRAKIPRQGKATSNIRLRTAVAVWSVAAGLTATWFLLKPVPDSEEAEELHLHIDFDASKQFSEIDIDTIFDPKEIDEPVEEGIPESLDWSQLGFLPVTPWPISFIYQNSCGSCWAIAAVKSVEWAYVIKHGKTFPLSVQQLIDCGKKFDHQGLYPGCAGGCLRWSFSYIAEAGLTYEEAYPCSLFQGSCRLQLPGHPIAVRIDGFEEIVPSEENFILALQSGPIAVRVYANQYFALFGGGCTIELERCPPSVGTLHCVVLVGYGVEKDGQKYWKIENTYGVLWGEYGYAKLRRGVSDPHGVAGMLKYYGYRPTGVQDTRPTGVQDTQDSDSD